MLSDKTKDAAGVTPRFPERDVYFGGAAPDSDAALIRKSDRDPQNSGTLYFLPDDEALRKHVRMLDYRLLFYDIVVDALRDENGEKVWLILMLGDRGALRANYQRVRPSARAALLKLDYRLVKPDSLGSIIHHLFRLFCNAAEAGETTVYYGNDGPDLIPRRISALDFWNPRRTGTAAEPKPYFAPRTDDEIKWISDIQIVDSVKFPPGAMYFLPSSVNYGQDVCSGRLLRYLSHYDFVTQATYEGPAENRWFFLMVGRAATLQADYTALPEDLPRACLKTVGEKVECADYRYVARALAQRFSYALEHGEPVTYYLLDGPVLRRITAAQFCGTAPTPPIPEMKWKLKRDQFKQSLSWGSVYYPDDRNILKFIWYTTPQEHIDIRIDLRYGANGEPDALIVTIAEACALQADPASIPAGLPRLHFKLDYRETDPKDIGAILRGFAHLFGYNKEHGIPVTYAKKQGVFQVKISKEEYDAM